MGTQHERKFQRFKLKYHVRVNFKSENTVAAIDAVTRNVSLGGLLLESACLIPHLSPVEFTITLDGATVSRPVKLAGVGDVVRVEPGELADRFGIAVACREPITQLTDHLPENP